MDLKINEIKKLSRGEKAILNVVSHIGLFSNLKIKEVIRETNENYIIIRIRYIFEKNNKEYLHSYSFYRYGEEQESELFFNTLLNIYKGIKIIERKENIT